MMLQQTQTSRVEKKYPNFISSFPDFSVLAAAPLKEVLHIWQGLGYNRRALFLKRTAELVISEYRGILPSSPELLQRFPGIGKATAAAIAVFAFGDPAVFIETNIRTVFIHFFFSKREHVTDSEILTLVEKTMDRTDPRTWYYAVMDYGAMLKKTHNSLHRKSTLYRKQPPFKGSNREIRGRILRLLTMNLTLTEKQLNMNPNITPEKIRMILEQMEEEGFLEKHGRTYRIVP